MNIILWADREERIPKVLRPHTDNHKQYCLSLMLKAKKGTKTTKRTKFVSRFNYTHDMLHKAETPWRLSIWWCSKGRHLMPPFSFLETHYILHKNVKSPDYFRYIKILTWLRGFLVIFFFIGLVFFVLKSLMGIARQWSRKKIAILTLKPPSHVRILICRTLAISPDYCDSIK